MNITIREANLDDAQDAQHILTLINTYARDPKGGGELLPPDVQARLLPGLKAHPAKVVLLALAANEAVGIAVCFFSFSTFTGLPVMNIHDLAVNPSSRGKGIGRALLAEAEKHARGRSCGKMTLEVQDNNANARALYASFGFTEMVVNNSAFTRFMNKPLVSRK
jgi:ribosomal protein S18 acetylase RimI-like enzyme